MKFYVGNLNFRISEDQLRALFEPYGPIDDLIILTDRETGRSRGFGFITLADDEKAKQAYADLNQSEFEGRTLVMNEAQPRENRPNAGGFSGGHSGGGYQKRSPHPAAAGTHRATGGGYANHLTNRSAPPPQASPSPEADQSATDTGDDGAAEGESTGYSRG